MPDKLPSSSGTRAWLAETDHRRALGDPPWPAGTGSTFQVLPSSRCLDGAAARLTGHARRRTPGGPGFEPRPPIRRAPDPTRSSARWSLSSRLRGRSRWVSPRSPPRVAASCEFRPYGPTPSRRQSPKPAAGVSALSRLAELCRWSLAWVGPVATARQRCQDGLWPWSRRERAVDCLICTRPLPSPARSAAGRGERSPTECACTPPPLPPARA